MAEFYSKCFYYVNIAGIQASECVLCWSQQTSWANNDIELTSKSLGKLCMAWWGDRGILR